MSNKSWYIILALFSLPLLVILIIAYLISFVLTGNIDNTNQLTDNLAVIHSVISTNQADELDEFSAANVAAEKELNENYGESDSQTTLDRLKLSGYEILYNEDINKVTGNEIVAVKTIDLSPPDTFEDMIVVSDFRVYTEGRATDNGWPLIILDSINLPTSVLSMNEPPKNNLFALKSEWDPNGRIQFTICPLDHQGDSIAQCGGYIWDGPRGEYDFYGGGKYPEWDNLQ